MKHSITTDQPRTSASAGTRQRHLRRAPTLSVITTALLLGATLGDAHAGRQPAGSDLEVQLTGPATANINVAETYEVTVTNRGRDRSASIDASVSFPIGNTSPQAFILGTVTPLDSRCSMVGQVLRCNLASLRKGWSTTFQFRYAAPVSTRALPITASVASTSPDPVPGNNSSTTLPNLTYPARPIGSSIVMVRACTGNNLSAFQECTQFPGSIISFPAELRSDLTIDLGQPGYTGSWSQNAAKTSLRMEFFADQGQGPVKVVDFNGWAINGANCFHGLATFPQSPAYVSPYEVCLP